MNAITDFSREPWFVRGVVETPEDAERNREWVRDIARGADVTQHLRYFNSHNMTPDETTAVIKMLREFGLATGNMWRPGECRKIPNLTGYLNEIRAQTEAAKYFGPLVPKRWDHFHYFLASPSITDGRILIMDPTGVPHIDSVTPYFGLPEYAPASHRHRYERMKDMDDQGTRQFPRNFRP